MKKLKLLFPLLGTSALAVAPALSAQANQTFKSKSNDSYGLPPTKTRDNRDNNKTLFAGGYSSEYYYDQDFAGYYSEANFLFTFTSAGSMALAKAKIASSDPTSKVFMTFLDKNLKHFDNGIKNSYLNEIEDASSDSLMYHESDGYAWNDFMNSIDPGTLDKLVTDYKNGDVLPELTVKFHYAYHLSSHDDFDVSFTLGKWPSTPETSFNPASFTGHFPGMGPYGKAGDQDHAKLISSESTSESLKLDLSTKSINYINSHFLNKPVPSSKIALAVMDYLWKAYPSSDWKATLAGILRAGGVSAVNYAFGKLIDFIGTYQKDGKTLLKNTPAYYYIKDGDSFTAAKNQPFS